LKKERQPCDALPAPRPAPRSSLTTTTPRKKIPHRKTSQKTAVFASGHAAARLWDVFYKTHAASFFRDRHYLEREWPLLGSALAAADARVEAAAAAETAAAAEPAAAATGAPASSLPSSIIPDPVAVLEAGCGAGNAVLPLLKAHLPGAVRAYACDFAPAAVELVHASDAGREAAARGALDLWVADVAGADDGEGAEKSSSGSRNADTNNPLVGPGRAPPGGCDFVTYIFVLSALEPRRVVLALRHAAAALKVGTGRLLVRDYAAGDLAQARLAAGGGSVGSAVAAAAAAAEAEGEAGAGAGAGAAAAGAPPRPPSSSAADDKQRLSGRLYVRGDGTCAYYFEAAELAAMARKAGLRVAPAEESSAVGGDGDSDDGGGGGGGGGGGDDPACRRGMTRVERAPCGVELVSRTVVNRASGAVMERRWLQAAFYRPAAVDEHATQQQPAAAAAALPPSPQKKRVRDDVTGAPSPPPQQPAPLTSDPAADAAVALARLRAPYCFRPLGGGAAGPSSLVPEFRALELPSAAAAAGRSAPSAPPLRWRALKSALPAGGAYAARLEGWAAEVAAALASAAAGGGGGGGGGGGPGASVVVIPCPGDAPSHAAAALLALHAVRVGPEGAQRAACAVLSAGDGPVGAAAGDDDDDDDALLAQEEEEEEEEEEDAGRAEYAERQQQALRAYRLTLAANAPLAVFERVATWRLAPAPAEGSGREDPHALSSSSSSPAAANGSCGPFDVAIALPAASAALSAALEAWRRRQQRRVLALAVGSGGGVVGGVGGGVCCVLDFAAAISSRGG
jgi:SAM-dependent methyltransferase